MLKDEKKKGSYHQDKDHGTLVDVVRVHASSLPEPAPETIPQEEVFTPSQKAHVSLCSFRQNDQTLVFDHTFFQTGDTTVQTS